MAKRKDSMALFEAISKSKEKHSREGFVVPGWMENKAQTAQSEEASSASAAATPANQGAEPAASKESAVGSKATLASLKNKPVVWAVVAAVVLLAAFFVHRAMPKSDSPEAIPLPEMNPNGPADANAPAAADKMPVREPGKLYLIIQVLPHENAKDDAQKIVDWLWTVKKEPAEVRPAKMAGKNCWIVYSLRGFDSVDELSKYAAKIDALGKEYNKIGNYRLKQDLKKLWYKKEEQPK